MKMVPRRPILFPSNPLNGAGFVRTPLEIKKAQALFVWKFDV
jgi:hypothetical protein